MPAATQTSDDLRTFTLADTAERLGVSVDTVRRLLDGGQLTVPAHRPRRRGSVTLITAASLREYLYGSGADA